MTQTDYDALGGGELAREDLFPIREVSRLTGINPVTLRAWERRYGLVQPTRTESGHRLYSQADIDEVRSILGWIERGVAVSKVGKILAKAQTAKAREGERDSAVLLSEHGEWQAQLGRAVRQFDETRLEQIYGQVFSSYPMAVVFQDILMPVWQQALLQVDQFGQLSEWLFLDNFLRARTLQRLQMTRGQGQDARVLLAAMPGKCRELELLVAGLLLGSDEVAVHVLAMGQPLEELSLVCDRMQPHGVVLFSSYPPKPDFARQVLKLSMGLGCPLMVAGEASELAHDSLVNTDVACLGNDGRLMQRRLQQCLAGRLDT
ncbi:MAG: MerR family transcriptional regulator [Pseudomonas sp.]|uniref:MerR family transcriptional regulator n=1 Tax=Pseudomonas abieticivorans TaxID=2931382 RepID=UPI0020C064D7|nr:MerR family transcriptional regulator [Pseudomonas sp. PIA16]MDE1165006.1 MerR family transcriptional regulator [Pseudomonas sp.]